MSGTRLLWGYAKRGDEACPRLDRKGYGRQADFTLLHRDNESPYTDDRPLLVAGKPGLREYNSDKSRAGAVRILADAEIGLFSDEIVVNCAP
jgi:hypothetical protein